MTITITGANDAPGATDDAYTTGENTTLSIAGNLGLVINDSDPDTTDVLTVGSVNSTGTKGIVTFNADGSFTYDPNGQFENLAVGETATDTFAYTITDGQGGSDTGSVTITITGANDAPGAVDDAYMTGTNTTLNVAAGLGLLVNDSDPDTTDVLAVNSVNTAGTKGTVTFNADGSFTYNPNGQFNDLQAGETAIDSFIYTMSDGHGGSDSASVAITINGANDAPTAVDDQYTTNEDTQRHFAAPGLLGNDIDPDGDVLTVINVNTTGTKGTVTRYDDGSFTYNPNGKFESLAVGQTATDTFTYTVSDGKGGSSTASVTIAITGVNDAPNALDDAYAAIENTLLQIAAPGLLGNDTDVDAGNLLTVSGVSTRGTLGKVTWNADGRFTYDSNGKFESLAAGQKATDSFNYTLSDGKGGSDTATVIITITGVNDTPNAVDDIYATDENTLLQTVAPGLLGNDTDVDSGDLLTVSGVGTTGTLGNVTWNANGSFTYDPNGKFESLAAGQTATDRFVYMVSDGKGGADAALVTIIINGANDAPTAVDDTYATGENALLQVVAPGLLGNDSDVDASDLLTVSGISTTGTVGNVTWNANGSFTYDPNGKFESLAAGQTATDSFIYTASDGKGGSDSASVTITITGVNEVPVAASDMYETNKDTPLHVTANLGLLANDSDPNGNLLEVTAVDTAGMLGEVTWNADGSFTYDPLGKFENLGVGETVTDTFLYTISDGKGGSDTASVTITIIGDTLQVSQLVINDGSAQRSIVTSVSVAFNADVTVAQGAFQLINRATGAVVSTSFTTSLDSNGKTIAAVSFLQGPSVQVRASGNSLMDGNYQLTIDATKVTHNGLQLDGDANGTAGDSYLFGEALVDNFFRFFGDTDGDRDVDGSDYGRFGLTFRKTLGQAGFNPYLDYDGDGDVDGQEYGQFSLRFRKRLDFN